MIVAFDNTFLSLAFNPATKPRANPATKQAISHCALRVEALIDELSARGDKVIIPAPCLAELLCVVPDFEQCLQQIEQSTAFQVEPFDMKAAVGLAQITRRAIDAGNKKAGSVAGWQEIKFDRQIAMIAKVNRAKTLYTDDGDQANFAKEIGLNVRHTWHLDLPAKYAQTSMPLERRDDTQ
jgi:predicted nucleic acid-binding protein